MEEQGSSRVEIAGINDKRQITLTLAGSMSGELLPFQLLYQGKTVRCHPHHFYPSEFDVWHTPNHWANEETTLQFINVILPYVKINHMIPLDFIWHCITCRAYVHTRTPHTCMRVYAHTHYWPHLLLLTLSLSPSLPLSLSLSPSPSPFRLQEYAS